MSSKKERKVPIIPIWPTLVTMGNLICGFLAVCYVADGIGKAAEIRDDRWCLAAWMILVGMVFDVLDGRVARLTGMSSDFGKEMDSLCDMVTFGLAPAFLMKVLSEHLLDGISYLDRFDFTVPKFTFLISVAYAACTCLRLARFNVETGHDIEDHRYFRGLPSPGAAGCVATLAILYFFVKEHALGVTGETPEPHVFKWTFAVLVPLISFTAGLLMVSRIRYIHIANIYLGGSKPFFQVTLTIFTFLGLIAAIFYTRGAALAFVFNLYMIAGLVIAVRRKMLRKKTVEKKTAEDAADTEEDEEPLFE